jgi:hypothetical protein
MGTDWKLELLKIAASFLSGVTAVIIGSPYVEIFKDRLTAWRGRQIRRRELVENLEGLFGTGYFIVRRVYAAHVEEGLTPDERALAVSALPFIKFDDLDAKLSKLSPLGNELFRDLLEIVLLMKAVSSRALSVAAEDRNSVRTNLVELTTLLELVDSAVRQTYYKRLHIDRDYIASLTSDYAKQKVAIASKKLSDGADNFHFLTASMKENSDQLKAFVQQVTERRKARMEKLRASD